MTDDELMEKFFSGETFDEHELAKGLRIGVRNGDIRPVYCGSAENQTGIERLLDLITEYFPATQKREESKLKHLGVIQLTWKQTKMKHSVHLYSRQSLTHS